MGSLPRASLSSQVVLHTRIHRLGKLCCELWDKNHTQHSAPVCPLSCSAQKPRGKYEQSVLPMQIRWLGSDKAFTALVWFFLSLILGQKETSASVLCDKLHVLPLLQETLVWNEGCEALGSAKTPPKMLPVVCGLWHSHIWIFDCRAGHVITQSRNERSSQGSRKHDQDGAQTCSCQVQEEMGQTPCTPLLMPFS